MADAAVTVVVPPSAPMAERLVQTAETALADGIAAARAGRPPNAIGRAVGRSVERAGFAVRRRLTGHGIGRTIHEAPDILNYDEPRNRGRLTPGLVITIEPIISARRSGPAPGRGRLDGAHARRFADRACRAHGRRDAPRIATRADIWRLGPNTSMPTASYRVR